VGEEGGREKKIINNGNAVPTKTFFTHYFNPHSLILNFKTFPEFDFLILLPSFQFVISVYHRDIGVTNMWLSSVAVGDAQDNTKIYNIHIFI
jgi:hypothetical protein